MTTLTTTLIKLDSSDQTNLEHLVGKNEDFRAIPYNDASGLPISVAGNITVGYGYNLSAGMSIDIALMLMRIKLCEAEQDLLLSPQVPYSLLSPVRKIALLDMAYNMGASGLETMTDFLTYLRAEEFAQAAADLMATLWAREVGARAKFDANLIKTGIWQMP
jgi:lysozyme